MKYYFALWRDVWNGSKEPFVPLKERPFVRADSPEEAEEKIRKIRDKVRQEVTTATVIRYIWDEDGNDIEEVRKPSQMQLPPLAKPDLTLIKEAEQAQVKDIQLPLVSLGELYELYGSLLHDPYAEPPFNPEPRRGLLTMMKKILVDRGKWDDAAEEYLQKLS